MDRQVEMLRNVAPVPVSDKCCGVFIGCVGILSIGVVTVYVIMLHPDEQNKVPAFPGGQDSTCTIGNVVDPFKGKLVADGDDLVKIFRIRDQLIGEINRIAAAFGIEEILIVRPGRTGGRSIG